MNEGGNKDGALGPGTALSYGVEVIFLYSTHAIERLLTVYGLINKMSAGKQTP